MMQLLLSPMDNKEKKVIASAASNNINPYSLLTNVHRYWLVFPARSRWMTDKKKNNRKKRNRNRNRNGKKRNNVVAS